MKQIYKAILGIIFLLGGSAVHATVHTVFVANNTFTPSTVNAQVGDTVAWVLQAGTHTTTSVSIPSGAVPWNVVLSSSNPGHAIKVTIAGTYTYECTFHPGMTGTIVVTSPIGIGDASSSPAIPLVYPNPFGGMLTVNHGHADEVILYNMLGEKIYSVKPEAGTSKVELQTAALPQGVYFVSLVKNGVISETRKVVKNN